MNEPNEPRLEMPPEKAQRIIDYMHNQLQLVMRHVAGYALSEGFTPPQVAGLLYAAMQTATSAGDSTFKGNPDYEAIKKKADDEISIQRMTSEIERGDVQ